MLFTPKNLVLALSLTLFSTQQFAVEIESINLPDMGDSSGTLISPVQEQELGAAFFRSLHSRVKINQDPEVQNYIQSIGKQLVANSDLPANPFHFFVVIDKQINAFAGPGGYIGINSGLFLLTEEEGELASVMAHEVAHVTQRHLYRAFEAASRLSIPTAAATLAALLLGTQSAALGQAALIAIQAGSIQFQIDFTRDNEKEADRVGMQTLARSNYNPRSMPVFFERLQQSSRYYGQGVPEFLRTHPVSASRISDTRGRSNKYPYKQYPDSIAYLLTKAKLRVITASDQQIALNYFKTREFMGTNIQQAIARYGIALVYLELRDYSAAAERFKELSIQYPDQPQYIYALGTTLFAAEQYDKSLTLFQNATGRFPSNNAIKIEYISALLKTEKPKQAKAVLNTLNYQTKQQPFYFELLAQAYADLNHPAESHRYLAEYYYAIGHTQFAILQTKLAQKSRGINFYLQAILNDRLNFFLNEERQRKSDQ